MTKVSIVKIFQDAAERGDPFAQFELGFALDCGNNGEQDFEKAAAWYAKAAEQGHKSAEINHLLQHVLGQAHSLQPQTVVARFQKLAESGDSEAQNNLGLCYQYGYGTPQDYQEAARWFRRAADSGLGTAQFNLGGLYYEGWGFEKNLTQAIEWYTRAAQQRQDLALLQLGRMYQKGIGVEVSLERALVLYMIAYRQGSVRAANHLAFMFKKGLGVPQDNSAAFQLYLESVNRPDTPEIADNPSYRGSACYWLGRMAENGEGTKRDLRAAKRWYAQGAACGQSNCVDALNRLQSNIALRRNRSKRSN